MKKQAGLILPYFLVLLFFFSGSVVIGNRYTSQQVQRYKEAELLFIGDQFRRAIQSYYEVEETYPKNIQVLLKDPRFQNRRHLRKIYLDPFTGNDAWVEIHNEQSKLIGIRSSSETVPIKKSNFSENYSSFNNKSCICEWLFVYDY